LSLSQLCVSKVVLDSTFRSTTSRRRGRFEAKRTVRSPTQSGPVEAVTSPVTRRSAAPSVVHTEKRVAQVNELLFLAIERAILSHHTPCSS